MERELIRLALREILTNGKHCKCGSRQNLHTIIETEIGNNPKVNAIVKCSECVLKDGSLGLKTAIDEKQE